MKFILDDFETSKAEKIFVDRAEPRSIFWDTYDRMKKDGADHPYVLSFYGMGGIGKSALCEKIRREVKEQAKASKFIDIDFDFVERRESYRILDYMRKKLSKECGYSFPMFELAYYTFMVKIGEDMKKPEIKSLISESPVLSFIMDNAGFIPGSGAVTEVISMMDKGVTMIRKIFFSKKPMLDKLDKSTPSELLQMLPVYFAADLREAMAGEKAPLIIFLDTYERLVNEFAAIGEPLLNDMWLRSDNGLIPRLPNVLWVISSREKLKWEELDGNARWDGVLNQYLLGTLSEKDCDEFLASAGVSFESARKEITDQTGGLPMYLDLCVEAYNRDGTTKADTMPDALFERVVRYMDDAEKNMVFMLACLETWTNELAYEAGRALSLDFSPAFYEKLCSFSFVQTFDGVNYTMMHVVGEVLRERCPKRLRDLYFAWVANKGRKELADITENEDNSLPEEEDSEILWENEPLKYVRFKLDSLSDEISFSEWVCYELDRKIKDNADSYRFALCFDILSEVCGYCEKSFAHSAVSYHLTAMTAYTLYKCEDFANSSALFEAAILGMIENDYDPIKVEYYVMAYLVLKVRGYDCGNKELLERTWEYLEKNYSGSDGAHFIADRLYDGYSMAGDAENAKIWKARLESSDIKTNTDNTERVLTDGIEILKKQISELEKEEKYGDAYALALKLIEESIRLYGEDSVRAVEAYEVTYPLLHLLGRYDEYLEYCKKAYDGYCRIYGDESPIALVTGADGIAMFLIIRRDDTGLDLLKELLGKMAKVYGENGALYVLYKAQYMIYETRGLTCTEYKERIALVHGELEKIKTAGLIDDFSDDIEQLLADTSALLLQIPMAEAPISRDIIDSIIYGGGYPADSEREDTKQFDFKLPPAPDGDMNLLEYTAALIDEYKLDLSLYAFDRIPGKKLKNALNAYAKGTDGSDAAVIFDTTVLGNAKKGIMLTLSEMYTSGGNNGGIPLSDVDGFDFDKTCIYPIVNGRPLNGFVAVKPEKTAMVLNAVLCNLRSIK